MALAGVGVFGLFGLGTLLAVHLLRGGTTAGGHLFSNRLILLTVPLTVGALIGAVLLAVSLTRDLHLSDASSSFLWEGTGVVFLLPVLILGAVYLHRTRDRDVDRR